MTNGNAARARQIADDMAAWAWRRRRELLSTTKIHGMAEGVKLAHDAIANGATPVILADYSDRSGYATWLLREIVQQDLPDTLVATVTDAPALERLGNAKAGDAFDMAVGGRFDDSAGEPVRITGTVHSVIERAGELGMVAIVGYFYFGQDQRVKDEAAVRRAVANATNWLLDHNYRNALVEIDNETNVKAYEHDILKPDRVHELIEMAKGITRDGRRMLVGTSYGGGTPAAANVVKASDFLLLHGNGPDDPARIRKMIQASRQAPAWRPMPVLINEDDHFRFNDPDSHLMTALSEYVSWGYFDPGKSDYSDGYQCPPVSWGINTGRKRQFFSKLKEVTGA